MAITIVWEAIAVTRGGYPLGIQTIYPALALSVAALVGVSLARRGRL
jgi:hypothetical protein